MRALLTEQATQHAATQRAFEARIKKLVSGSKGNHKKRSGGKGDQSGNTVARQYIKYCGSHGVNLSHHSKDCRDKKPGHNDLATYDNKMGGSTRGNDWWMKWRGKDYQLCVECPPD